MFKTSSIPFIGPRVISKTKISPSKSATISWSAGRAKGRSSPSFVPFMSTLLVVAVIGLMALHLFWVNTYSSKGFELQRVQTAIQEKTEIQKKLLVKQSLMSSTVSLSDLSSTGLVPVTESETLNGNTFAQAK